MVKCADDLSESFDKLKDLCLGLHVAKVNNDVIAFVFKTYESAMDLPTGYVIHKPSTARFSATIVKKYLGLLFDCQFC